MLWISSSFSKISSFCACVCDVCCNLSAFVYIGHLGLDQSHQFVMEINLCLTPSVLVFLQANDAIGIISITSQMSGLSHNDDRMNRKE